MWLTPVWRMHIDAEGLADEYLKQFAKHVRDGKTAWPVRTGASQAGFEAHGKALYNTQEYAPFVEHADKSPHKNVLADAYERFQANLQKKLEKDFYRG